MNSPINTKDIGTDSQRLRLLAALRVQPINTLQARRDLNVLAPAVRIFELKAHGHDIHTTLGTVEGHPLVATYELLNNI